MAKSRRKLIAGLTQPKYALLQDLTDQAVLDAPTLEAALVQAVDDRFALARGFVDAAKVLAASQDPIVRRSAVSRAYYGAYHAARAVVFAVHRRDEKDHDKVAQGVDALLRRQGSLQTALKELRDLRNEMDYSPYPGPDDETEYEADEIEGAIGDTIRKTQGLIGEFDGFLKGRR